MKALYAAAVIALASGLAQAGSTTDAPLAHWYQGNPDVDFSAHYRFNGPSTPSKGPAGDPLAHWQRGNPDLDFSAHYRFAGQITPSGDATHPLAHWYRGNPDLDFSAHNRTAGRELPNGPEVAAN